MTGLFYELGNPAIKNETVINYNSVKTSLCCVPTNPCKLMVKLVICYIVSSYLRLLDEILKCQSCIVTLCAILKASGDRYTHVLDVCPHCLLYTNTDVCTEDNN